MMQIPTRGLRGVRAKLRAMMRPEAWEAFKRPVSDYNAMISDDMLHSLIGDLERMAGMDATETRQDEQPAAGFAAVHEFGGKRVDPKEWASHIFAVNVAFAVLSQDSLTFENRLRETMCPDASEWTWAMDCLSSSKEYLAAISASLDAAQIRILFVLCRIAGIDRDEQAEPAGPDSRPPSAAAPRPPHPDGSPPDPPAVS